MQNGQHRARRATPKPWAAAGRSCWTAPGRFRSVGSEEVRRNRCSTIAGKKHNAAAQMQRWTSVVSRVMLLAYRTVSAVLGGAGGDGQGAGGGGAGIGSSSGGGLVGGGGR